MPWAEPRTLSFFGPFASLTLRCSGSVIGRAIVWPQGATPLRTPPGCGGTRRGAACWAGGQRRSRKPLLLLPPPRPQPHQGPRRVGHPQQQQLRVRPPEVRARPLSSVAAAAARPSSPAPLPPCSQGVASPLCCFPGSQRSTWRCPCLLCLIMTLPWGRSGRPWRKPPKPPRQRGAPGESQ